MQLKGRQRRQKRVRGKVSGSPKTPRLNVYRSNRNIYAQIIDDENRVTLVSVSDKGLKKPGTIESAQEVGKIIAQKAKKAGVKKVVFDRAGYKYHGKVKAIAESARQEGLKI